MELGGGAVQQCHKQRCFRSRWEVLHRHGDRAILYPESLNFTAPHAATDLNSDLVLRDPGAAATKISSAWHQCLERMFPGESGLTAPVRVAEQKEPCSQAHMRHPWGETGRVALTHGGLSVVAMWALVLTTTPLLDPQMGRTWVNCLQKEQIPQRPIKKVKLDNNEVYRTVL